MCACARSLTCCSRPSSPRLQQELGLSADVLTKGKRRRVVQVALPPGHLPGTFGVNVLSPDTANGRGRRDPPDACAPRAGSSSSMRTTNSPAVSSTAGSTCSDGHLSDTSRSSLAGSEDTFTHRGLLLQLEAALKAAPSLHVPPLPPVSRQHVSAGHACAIVERSGSGGSGGRGPLPHSRSGPCLLSWDATTSSSGTDLDAPSFNRPG